MCRLSATILSTLLGLSAAAMAQDDQWIPVTGVDPLRGFMSGLTAERELVSGEVARGEYAADGTGVLHEWGASLPRTWEVKGEDQLCFISEQESGCYWLEENKGDTNLFRVKGVSTGKYHEFRVTDKRAVATGLPAEVGSGGGAASASAAEIAAQLANPNTPLASMNFKFQYRTFEGDLPNANDQDSFSLVFQPVLPFPLDKGEIIYFRPAIPLHFNQPVFNAAKLDFDSEAGLGDISFDLGYGVTKENGTILAAGFVSSLPTATKDELGSDRFTLGPEFLLGKVSKTHVLGMFPNHQWDVGGSGDKDINLTTTQLFGIYLPGGGWNVGTTPILSYDHEESQWTIPLNLTVGKTVIISGRPWKFGMEVNYYVEKPDVFGPEWFISFNATPVVENGLAKLFK